MSLYQSVGVLHRNKNKKVYHKELADEIMETDKSHNLQSANWRLKIADVFPVQWSEVQDPRTADVSVTP